MEYGCVIAFAFNKLYKWWNKKRKENLDAQEKAEAEARNKPVVAVGCTVGMHGLAGKPELDGKTAVVLRKQDDGQWVLQRWDVILQKRKEEEEKKEKEAQSDPVVDSIGEGKEEGSAGSGAGTGNAEKGSTLLAKEENLTVVLGVNRFVTDHLKEGERCTICWVEGGLVAAAPVEKVITPCCHKEGSSIIYCRRCIEIIIEQDGAHGIGKCPTCRKPLAIDSRTVSVRRLTCSRLIGVSTSLSLSLSLALSLARALPLPPPLPLPLCLPLLRALSRALSHTPTHTCPPTTPNPLQEINEL